MLGFSPLLVKRILFIPSLSIPQDVCPNPGVCSSEGEGSDPLFSTPWGSYDWLWWGPIITRFFIGRISVGTSLTGLWGAASWDDLGKGKLSGTVQGDNNRLSGVQWFLVFTFCKWVYKSWCIDLRVTGDVSHPFYGISLGGSVFVGTWRGIWPQVSNQVWIHQMTHCLLNAVLLHACVPLYLLLPYLMALFSLFLLVNTIHLQWCCSHIFSQMPSAELP